MKTTLTEAEPDYGFDQFERDETGKCIRWKMVPSGRIVGPEYIEAWRKARGPNKRVSNEIFGMSWDQLEQRQGGKLTRL